MIVNLAQDIPAFVMYCVYETSHSSLLIESTDSMIMLDKASNMLPHWTESVDFNGAGFVLIESTIFEIFGFFTCSSWFCIVLTRSTTLR